MFFKRHKTSRVRCRHFLMTPSPLQKSLAPWQSLQTPVAGVDLAAERRVAALSDVAGLEALPICKNVRNPQRYFLEMLHEFEHADG